MRLGPKSVNLWGNYLGLRCESPNSLFSLFMPNFVPLSSYAAPSYFPPDLCPMGLSLPQLDPSPSLLISSVFMAMQHRAVLPNDQIANSFLAPDKSN
jgi:ABC-type multidrug transport system permease subunit